MFIKLLAKDGLIRYHPKNTLGEGTRMRLNYFNTVRLSNRLLEKNKRYIDFKHFYQQVNLLCGPVESLKYLSEMELTPQGFLEACFYFPVIQKRTLDFPIFRR